MHGSEKEKERNTKPLAKIESVNRDFFFLSDIKVCIRLGVVFSF